MTARWLIPVLLLAACAPGSPPIASVGAPSSSAIGESPLTDASPEVVAGLSFGPPTAQQLDFLEHLHQNGWSGWTCLAEASVTSGGGWGPRSVYSGNYDFNLNFGSFPEGETRLAARALSTAEVPRDTDDAAALVERIVKPVVAAWDASAELARDYVGMPRFTSGVPEPAWVKDEASILDKFGWPLSYRSRARQEIVSFHLAPGRMLVVRTTFDGPVPTEGRVAVGREAAIAKARAVLEDPAAKSLEERTGRDYLSGLPYRPFQAGDPVGAADTVEPAFDLPDSLSWRAELYGGVAGKPLWMVYSQPTAQPSPVSPLPVGSTFTSVDYATETWIDADTGEAIRFRRAQRTTSTIVGTPSPFTPPTPLP